MVEGNLFSFDETLTKIPLSFLWIAFFIFVILSLVLSLALMFHWNKYRLHSPANYLAQLVYIVGLLSLFILGGISLTLFGAQ